VTQGPVDNRPTHPFEPIAAAGLAFVALVFLCPMQLWLVRQFAAPPINTAAVYRDGALDMCLLIARNAEIPAAQVGPLCDEWVSQLE
jgi:hypothetical protein